MSKIKLLFLFLLTVSIFTSCAFLNRKISQSMTPWQMSGVNSESFRSSRLKSLNKYTSLNYKLSTSSIYYTGDISGSEEKEIVIISRNTISIFSIDGTLIREKTFEEMDFGPGLLADIDKDGKQDIIIGAAKSKGANILVYSGLLEPVLNFLYSDIYNAETRVHFYHNNNIYFTTKSSLLTPPKIVGAFDPAKEEISWSYFTGPAPLDIAANANFTNLTISNTPANKNGLIMEEKSVSDHSKFRNSIYVLDMDGNVSTQISIGPEYRSGEFTKDGISSVTERLCDIDGDGVDELIVGINRISDFYNGNAALEVRTMEGTILNRREFLPNTELEFSFFDTRKGKNIAVLLKQEGLFYILDSNLNIIGKRDTGDLKGEFSLQESGDYNGDGLIEHLVTIGNMLFIFDSQLETLFSKAFTAIIKKASFTADKNGNPVLVVQSSKIDLYMPGKENSGYVSVFTDPPGADIYADGEKLSTIPLSGVIPPLPVGRVTFQAKMDGFESMEVPVNVREGQHSTIVLKLEDYAEDKEPSVRQQNDLYPIPAPEVPLKSWNDIHLIREMEKDPDEVLITPYLIDLAGDSSGDLLFRTKEDGIYKTYDLSMRLLSQFQLPAGFQSNTVELETLDLDNNGKIELLIRKKYNEDLLIGTSQGKVLEYKILGRFYDSILSGKFLNKNQNLYFTMSSGYAQQPRGMVGISLENNKIIFLSPTAAAPIRLLLSQENILLATIHTPTNGAVITYPNGDTAKDSEYYIYMTDLEGNHLDTSFNPEFEDNNGVLFYYMADLDNNGKREVYLVANKTNYYTGRSKIVRIDMKNGSISEPLFTSKLNDRIYIHSVLKKDSESVLAVRTATPGKLHFLSETFELLKTYNVEEMGVSYNWVFPDLNGDGSSEIIIWDKKGFDIFDLDFNLLFSLEADSENGDLKNLLLDDSNGNGKYEIILVSDNSVSVYSY